MPIDIINNQIMGINSLTKREFLKYLGDFSQVFGIKEYMLLNGKSKGIRTFDFRNGSGLEFTVLADRCLDFSNLSFKAVNCSYISKTGIVAPNYFTDDDKGFLRNFYGGFLTTCGLRNVGNSCVDQGELFGVHGTISNTPADEICARVEWVDDKPVMKLSGKVREASFFGENLVLHREIMCRYGENKIYIQNTIENCGFNREVLMLLFHFNLGYPLLNEDAILVTPTEKLISRDNEALKGIDNYKELQKPTQEYAEQVFYHDLKTDSEQKTCVALINKRLELAVAIRFDKTELFNFTQWKQMGESEYVLGLEPSNCKVGGRAKSREDGDLEYLEPGESKKFDLIIEIVDGLDNIDLLIKEINDL